MPKIGSFIGAKLMDLKTRSAIIGKDMNRMELPVHPRASSKPRATPRVAPDREDPVDAIIDRAMAALARDEEEIADRSVENLQRHLLEQVAGKPIAEIRHD
jgi:hypothetical protein